MNTEPKLDKKFKQLKHSINKHLYKKIVCYPTMKDEIKYRIMSKIKELSEEIKIMLQKQEDFRQENQTNNCKKDREEMEKQFENVAKGVDSLATHCELKSTKLKEIKELLLTLSEDVDIITETVEHIKDSYIKNNIDKGTKSEDAKDRLENVSVSSSFSGNTDCVPIDKRISSPEIVTSCSLNNEEKYTQFETKPTDESIAYVRPEDCGQYDNDNLDVDTPSENNSFQYKSVSDKPDANCQIDKLDLNCGKVADKHETDHIQTMSKCNVKIRRNDLGFKSLSTEWHYDNRLSFYSKGFEDTSCSPVSDVKKTVTNKPNIQQQYSTDASLQFHPHRRPAGNRKRRNTGYSDVDTDTSSNMGLDITGQPKTINDWLQHYKQVCEHAQYRLRSGTVRRTTGRYVTLVLDISERLRGRKFEVMIKAAAEYVEGVKQVWVTTGLEENIGLAVFGGKNQLVHECTSDLDLILRSINKLEPCGDAPAIGGLLMGEAGVITGPFGNIGDFPLQGHIIIFTDSGSEGNTSSSSSPFPLTKGGIDLKSMLDNANGSITLSLSSTGISLGSSLEGIEIFNHAGVESVVHSIVRLQTKVFYVQIGKNQKNAIFTFNAQVYCDQPKISAQHMVGEVIHLHLDILERIVNETNGKILDTREMHRLLQMTKVMMIAARIASNIVYSADQSKESIKQQIKEESGSDDPYNDCLDMVLEFVNPLSVEKRRGKYTELTCRSLQLGDRVRRGPDWRFGNQDNHLAGTVIGQESHGIVKVQWDNGDTNIYMQCDETCTFSLRKVDEPKVLVDEMIAVGCRVVRGQDWRFGDKDGGVGSLGTVLDVRPEGKVVVRWDSKRTGLYKMGYNGRFEVKVHGAPVRSRGKVNEHRSEYKSKPTSDSESEDASFRTSFRTTGDKTTPEPNDYVIPIYSDSTVSAIWEYEQGSEWKRYPNDINVKIEKAYQRKKTGKTIIEMDRTTYQIYFQRMIQENPSNKTEKSIRRKD